MNSRINSLSKMHPICKAQLVQAAPPTLPAQAEPKLLKSWLQFYSTSLRPLNQAGPLVSIYTSLTQTFLLCSEQQVSTKTPTAGSLLNTHSWQKLLEKLRKELGRRGNLGSERWPPLTRPFITILSQLRFLGTFPSWTPLLEKMIHTP